MYVPALAGMASHEEGHRNYQHPDRTGRDYHRDLDNFSAWVIFTSITALAIDPRFWDGLNAGDECLLFRQEDFEKPITSKALQTLEKNGNLQLQALVSHFRSVLSLPLSRIPSLDGSVLDHPKGPERNPDQVPESGTPGLPPWLGDRIEQKSGQAGSEPLPTDVPEATINGAEWLYDHLIDDSTTAQPRPPIIQIRDRIALWSSLGVLGVMVVAWAVSLVSSLVFTAIVLLALATISSILVLGYSAAKAAVQDRLKVGRTCLSEIEAEINLSKLERTRLGKPLVPLKRAYDELPKMIDVEAEKLDRNLARTLEWIEAQRRKAKQDEEAAIRAMDAEAEQLGRSLSKRLEWIEARRRKAKQDEEAAIKAMDAEAEQLNQSLARTFEGVEARRRRAKQDEEAAIKQLEHRIGTTVGQLVQKKAALALEEKCEIEGVLLQSRSLHVRTTLSQARLTSSAVSGIGKALVERLRASGVSCAYDVTYGGVRRILGIGEAKANALESWRQRIERLANSTAPSSLSQAEMSRIRGKYATASQSIELQIVLSKEEERNERQQIQQRCAAAGTSLDAEKETARRAFYVKRDALRTKSGKERERLAAESTSLQRTLNAEEELTRRTFDVQRDELRVKSGKERQRLAAESMSLHRTVHAEEGAAKLDHGLQRDAVRAKFDKEKARLVAEYKHEKKKVDEARETLDERIEQLNRSLFQQRIHVRQIELELDRLVDVDPMRYLLFVLLPKWSES
jgi:hypothetical protein